MYVVLFCRLWPNTFVKYLLDKTFDQFIDHAGDSLEKQRVI